MTISPDELAGRAGPRYLALAEAIGAAVAAGRLRPGERLPPQRALAASLGVTVGTVGRAYELAASRGLVQGEVGRGTFVTLGEPSRPRLRIREDEAGDRIDLTVNRPAPTPVEPLLIEAMAGLAGGGAGGLLRYVPSTGLVHHRAAFADWLVGLGLPAAPERVLLAAGAHGGLFLALQTLARAGEPVLVEQLSYPGLDDITRVLQLRPEPVALDAQGLVPEALAAACRQSGARLLVLTLNLHNPTTAQAPAARREAIAEVAARYDLTIVEDDVYGPLLAERPPALAALVPERTIHLASISKCVVPGLRLGSVLAPSRLIDALAHGVHALRVAEPPLTAELFRRWLEAGLIARAMEAQRAELAQRQELAAARLAGLAAAAVVTHPAAPHLWLELRPPWRPAELVAALAERGVLVAPGELFVIGRGTSPAAVRISLSGAADRAQLARGLDIVRATLDAGPPARPAVI